MGLLCFVVPGLRTCGPWGPKSGEAPEFLFCFFGFSESGGFARCFFVFIFGVFLSNLPWPKSTRRSSLKSKTFLGAAPKEG